MLVTEEAPLPVVARIGVQGVASYLIPIFMLLCGVLLWLIPIAWLYHSRLAILLALGSWITSNLGGFFIGLLIGVIGGALAYAWTTDGDYGPSGWLRDKPRIGLPSWALDAVSRLKERAGPRIGVHLARLHFDGAQAATAVGALARKILASARVTRPLVPMKVARKILASACAIRPLVPLKLARKIRATARAIPPLAPLKLARSWGRTRDATNRLLRFTRSNLQSLTPWHRTMESESAAEQRRPTERRRDS